MSTRRLYPGLTGLIDLLKNHYLIKARELSSVEAISFRLQSLPSPEADKNALHEIFANLKELADRVIERELGAPVFEGVSVNSLERAIELAELSAPEDDGPRPRVGAVILKDGRLIAEGSRNQDRNGGHAEQLAIESCSDVAQIAGGILLTTLEPCTNRGTKGRRPCAELLLKYGISKVLIGLPDPNPVIRGRGDILLRKNGITVSYFPSGLARRLWTLNAEFIAHHTADEFRQVFLYRT
jgi:pyrimidine deaminase RibD-like protein